MPPFDFDFFDLPISGALQSSNISLTLPLDGIRSFYLLEMVGGS